MPSRKTLGALTHGRGHFCADYFQLNQADFLSFVRDSLQRGAPNDINDTTCYAFGEFE
jgi:hypothetical protein